MQAKDLLNRRLAEARAFGAASEDLPTRMPEFSARSGLSTGQLLVGLALVASTATGFWFNPALTLVWLTAFVAFAFLLVIYVRCLAALSAITEPRRRISERMRDADLWDLTILVPLYREANVVADLMAALARLDYPVWRLDVKLLVEADDADTISALQAQHLPAHFEILPVPPGAPRTKPKALNYGLAFARGQFVAVFDAEDRPDPAQPRAAMAAFANGPDKLAVVQAPLHIHNADAGWLSRQFALEYAIHFRVWLPLLARLGLPLPLGGTSNYFRRDRLVQAGGWDAWNVTEDADIGLRLARFGGAGAMIAPPTEEEAPTRLRQWSNQRTRWMKGHLQTWLVLNRQPWRAMRGMGVRNFLCTQVTVGGGLLASMLHAPLYLWIAASLIVFQNVEPWHVALFVLGYASALAAAFAARTRFADPVSLLGMLAYWPLQSWAMLRALVEMQFRPYFWAKTPHGAHGPQTANHPDGTALPDNVIQLEFPFNPSVDAASHQLARR